MLQRRRDRGRSSDVENAEKRRQALVLRRSGATYEQIGRSMGYSTQRAHKVVTEELQEIRNSLTEEAEDLLQLQLQRIDALMMAHFPAATRTQRQVSETHEDGTVTTKVIPCEPSRSAAYLVLRLIEQQSRLAGISNMQEGGVIPLYFEIGIGEAPIDVSGSSSEVIDVDPSPMKVEKIMRQLAQEEDKTNDSVDDTDDGGKHRAVRRKRRKAKSDGDKT